VDANNQYGWAMCTMLPTKNFKWILDGNIQRDVIDRPSDAPRGCALEVDLSYPEELHDAHNDYPVAPESFGVKADMLSDKQRDLLKDGKYKEAKKLIPNLNEKKKYIVHYETLKQYIALGINVDKIHRVLEFDQCRWLKDYIDLNTLMRTAATSELKKEMYKLMNNAVFGKTMENVRKYRNMQFVTSEEKAKKLAGKANFKRFSIISDTLVLVEMGKTTIHFKKPIFDGFSILDVSKTIMYDFNYNYIKVKYPGEKSVLFFTDTDSFGYKIETEDIYKDMLDDHERFDFSGYPDNHPCFSSLTPDQVKHMKQKNKKVLGKFKDELAGFSMREFIGIRSKVYSFIVQPEQEEEFENFKQENNMCTKKLKGVQKRIVKKNIRHEHYKQCLLEGKRKLATMTTIRSYRHQLYTIGQTKLALNNFDDKRYILPDGVTTLAHGHYKIPKE
jgi:hypothetical protein